MSSCAQVLSWPHSCDLNHVISVALDKSHKRYFIPINNLKSCVAGVTAVSSVWFSAAVSPKSHSCLGIHSQESWRQGVYGYCEKSWWMTLQTLGCWTSVSLFKQCCLDVWNYSPGQISRQENIPTDGHFLREQGRHVADLIRGEPGRPERREVGNRGLHSPAEISGNPGRSDQRRHTQRGLMVDPETRSSAGFLLLISTCDLFSALAIVSGLNQAFWTCLRSGPQVYRGALGCSSVD